MAGGNLDAGGSKENRLAGAPLAKAKGRPGSGQRLGNGTPGTGNQLVSALFAATNIFGVLVPFWMHEPPISGLLLAGADVDDWALIHWAISSGGSLIPIRSSILSHLIGSFFTRARRTA